jgi:hypothetical protein
MMTVTAMMTTMMTMTLGGHSADTDSPPTTAATPRMIEVTLPISSTPKFRLQDFKKRWTSFRTLSKSL